MNKRRHLISLLLLAAPAALAQTPAVPLVASALAVGETAPAFKGQDAAGRPVVLRQLLKKGPVVLYFWPWLKVWSKSRICQLATLAGVPKSRLQRVRGSARVRTEIPGRPFIMSEFSA